MKHFRNRIAMAIIVVMFLLTYSVFAQVKSIWDFDNMSPVQAQLDGTAGSAWDPATSSLDTSIKKSGYSSLSGTFAPGPGSAVNGAVTNWGTLAVPIWTTPLNANCSGITQNYIGIWVYLTDVNSWADDYIFSVKIGSGANIDANNKRYVWRRVDMPGGNPLAGWTYFEKAAGSPFSQIGTLDWADIDWVEVQIYSANGKPTSTVRLDSLSVGEDVGPYQVVRIWEFDALSPVQAQLDGGAGTAWDPATSSLDTADYKSGTAAMSGTMAVGVAPAVNGQVTNWGTLGAPVWTNPLNIDVSAITRNYIGVWVYMSDTNTWAGEYLFSVKIGSGANLDANNLRYVWRRSIDFPGGIPNGWNYFEKAVSSTFSSAGTLDWADVDWLEVQLYSEPLKPSSTVKLDNLEVANTPGPHDLINLPITDWALY